MNVGDGGIDLLFEEKIFEPENVDDIILLFDYTWYSEKVDRWQSGVTWRINLPKVQSCIYMSICAIVW